MLADGHFGSADPIHHPQLLSDSSPNLWIVAIRRQTIEDKHVGIMWQPLNQSSDFEIMQTSSLGLGTVTRDFLARSDWARWRLRTHVLSFEFKYGRNRELCWLYDSMQDAVERLDVPATFRDIARQWACVQRYWLYATAWFDWYVGFLGEYQLEDYIRLHPSSCMGCFTNSFQLVASLTSRNIPVWLMRTVDKFRGDEIVQQHVSFTLPIECLPFNDKKHFTNNDALLTGRARIACLAGDNHIRWINEQASHYFDKESRVVPQNVDQGEGPSTLGQCSSVSWAAAASSGPSRSAASSNTRFEPCKFYLRFSNSY